MDKKDYNFLAGFNALDAISSVKTLKAELYYNEHEGSIFISYNVMYRGKNSRRLGFMLIENSDMVASLYAREINKILDGDKNANRLILDLVCDAIMDYEGDYLCFDTYKLDREKRFGD